MNTQASNDSSTKNGVSRMWIGLAVVAGAAIAYLADPQRGRARREAAARQISGAAQAAAEQTGRWRSLLSSRLPGQSREQLPAQVALPTERPGNGATRAQHVESPADTGAEAMTPED
jgi:hypothetical protein